MKGNLAVANRRRPLKRIFLEARLFSLRLAEMQGNGWPEPLLRFKKVREE